MVYSMKEMKGVIRAYPTAEAGQCGTPPLAEGRGQRVTPLPEDINGRVHYLEESSQGRPYSTTGDGQSETTLLHEGPDAPSLTKGRITEDTQNIVLVSTSTGREWYPLL
jgi:hypothetical protein